LEKGGKSSARSDEMVFLLPFSRAHFVLNCAKKGVLLPPKAGLPPLIGGALFVDFLYELRKRGPILN
jgi:hypothetical protein